MEIFCDIETVKRECFELVMQIWDTEDMPDEFVRGTFIPIYKNKGSPDDPSKYRQICLLPHAYKLLSTLLQHRLVVEVEGSGFLPEEQAGFRADRGTAEQIFILGEVIQEALKDVETRQGVGFIDYTAAFDTVSHRFLDTALETARYGRLAIEAY